jgi:hemerythrin
MDDQHGILMDTMTELRQAVMYGSNREQVSELLDRLIEFTRMHFWSEEHLLEQHNFPALNQHRAEHRRLLTNLLESSHRMQHGEAVQLRSLLTFLRDWLTEHIETLDQQYGPWLNECGVF